MRELCKMEETFNEGEKMKITAKTRTQVSGYGIVQPNETIDLDEGRINDRIMANFERADGQAWVKKDAAAKKESNDETPTSATKDPAEAKKDLIKRTAERMGREALIAALNGAAVQYAATETTNSLAKKYLRSIGQDVD